MRPVLRHMSRARLVVRLRLDVLRLQLGLVPDPLRTLLCLGDNGRGMRLGLLHHAYAFLNHPITPTHQVRGRSHASRTADDRPRNDLSRDGHALDASLWEGCHRPWSER